MPIYEFFCKGCNVLFDFFSPTTHPGKRPGCPRCGEILEKQFSVFSTVGKAQEPSTDGMPDFDKFKLERTLAELAIDAENINEEDPKQMVKLMRKFSEKSGFDVGDGVEEALSRIESGEDPEKVEQEMGDFLENEDNFAMKAQKGKKARRKASPEKDVTLYVL